jgi:O-antigen ligase
MRAISLERPALTAPVPEPRLDAPAAQWGPRVLALVLLACGAGLAAGFVSTLSLLTALGFGLAAAGLRWPPLGVIGVALLCTVDAPSRIYLMSDEGVLRYNTLNYALVLVAILAARRLWMVRELPVRLLELFVILLALELLLSVELELGIQHLANVASAFGLLAYAVIGGRERITWIWTGLVASAASAGGALVYYVKLLNLTYANPNAWAYFPLTGLFTACIGYVAADGRPRFQTTLALLAALNVVWVFLSGSRGALLVAILGVLLLFWATRGLSRRATILGTVLVAALVVSAQFADLQAGALGRLSKLADADRSLSNRTSGRFDLMLGGWYIFSDHPFGVGTGGFASAWAELGRREGMSGFESGARFPAHAGWIKTLAENGAPGVVLLAAFALSFAVVGLRTRSRVTRLLGIYTSAVLLTAWVSTEFQAKGLWFLAAATTACLRMPGRVPERFAPPIGKGGAP